MLKKENQYSLDFSISEYQLVNPNFAKVLIKIAYADRNRNRSNIPKEAFTKASNTLPYTPIVGHYLEDKGIFGGHDSELTVNDEGWQEKCLTIPYGVASAEEPFWKTFKELDGSYKDYFCCYGYLWIGRYPELKSIENGDYHQSMEISARSVSYSDDDYVVINDFIFDALCILQRDEPCFEGSTITTNFSKESFDKDYKEMVESLKKYALEELEGGEPMAKSKFENTSTEDEDFKKNGSQTQDEDNKDNKDNKGTKESKHSKEEDEDMANKKKCSNEGEDNKEDFESKYNDLQEKYRKISDELLDVKAKYSDLESDYSQLKEDNTSLNEYKLNKEKEEKEEVYNAKLEEFSALEGIDEFAQIKEKMFDFNLETLEKELKAIAFDNGVTIKKKASKKEFNVNKGLQQYPIDSNMSTDPKVDYATARYGADVVKQYSTR